MHDARWMRVHHVWVTVWGFVECRSISWQGYFKIQLITKRTSHELSPPVDGWWGCAGLKSTWSDPRGWEWKETDKFISVLLTTFVWRWVWLGWISYQLHVLLTVSERASKSILCLAPPSVCIFYLHVFVCVCVCTCACFRRSPRSAHWGQVSGCFGSITKLERKVLCCRKTGHVPLRASTQGPRIKICMLSHHSVLIFKPAWRWGPL